MLLKWFFRCVGCCCEYFGDVGEFVVDLVVGVVVCNFGCVDGLLFCIVDGLGLVGLY